MKILNTLSNLKSKRVFKHKKTGKLYELIQDRILFKDVSDEEYDYDIEGRPTSIIKREFDWRGKKDSYPGEQLILYKALYENPDGPYFVRHIDDFYNSFEEVKENVTQEIIGLKGFDDNRSSIHFICSKRHMNVSQYWCDEICGECKKNKKNDL